MDILFVSCHFTNIVCLIKFWYCPGQVLFQLVSTSIRSRAINFSFYHCTIFLFKYYPYPDGASGKEPSCQSRRHVRDAGSILGLRRSSGAGHGNHSSILAWRIPWTEEHGMWSESDMTKWLSLSQGNFNEAKGLLICEENVLVNILITTPIWTLNLHFHPWNSTNYHSFTPIFMYV